MTNDQFQFLTKLMRGNLESTTNKATHLVLVERLSRTEAIRITGVTKQALSRAIMRYSAAHKLAKAAYSDGLK